MRTLVRLFLSISDWKTTPVLVWIDTTWPHDLPHAIVNDRLLFGSVRATVTQRVLYLDGVVDMDVELYLNSDPVPDTPTRVEELSHEGWAIKEDPMVEKNQKLQKAAKPGQIAIKGSLTKPDLKGPDKPKLAEKQIRSEE